MPIQVRYQKRPGTSSIPFTEEGRWWPCGPASAIRSPRVLKQRRRSKWRHARCSCAEMLLGRKGTDKHLFCTSLLFSRILAKDLTASPHHTHSLYPLWLFFIADGWIKHPPVCFKFVYIVHIHILLTLETN